MAAAQFFLPYPVAFTSNGSPAAGAKLYFYVTGTLTPTDVFTSAALTTAHSNPVVANGAGRFPTIYTNDAVTLRLIIKDADGITLDDIDPYIPGSAGSPGTPGTNAATPVFTVATGTAGSLVTITGTYPNLLITVPRGTAGASGALSDGVLGVLTVSGGGTSVAYNDNSMALIKLAAAASAGFIGATGAGAYAHRTVAQVKTDLSLGNVTNTSDANKPVSTAQQAAIGLKRNLVPNEQTIASSATVTPTFSNDQVIITAQAAALALANPTGAAVNGWGIMVRIKDNGTARAITYGSAYRAIGVSLPGTTVASKTLYIGGIWNSADSKFDIVSVAQEV